jgi:hypothetical protein
MNYTLGEDRILYFKINGQYMPVGCLTGNSFEESSEVLDTTTRDNQGWTTAVPLVQSYSFSFEGLQLNTTVVGGNFNVASYDRLKQLKRDKVMLDWKIQGSTYPIVDYGKCFILSISESNNIGEFMSFSGSATGFGKPLTASLGTTVLNNGDPNVIVNNGNPNIILRTNEI